MNSLIETVPMAHQALLMTNSFDIIFIAFVLMAIVVGIDLVRRAVSKLFKDISEEKADRSAESDARARRGGIRTSLRKKYDSRRKKM